MGQKAIALAAFAVGAGRKMFIKVSFTTRWYWQIAFICNFAKMLGAKTTYYSCGTRSDFTPHPCELKH
jgi:hypothetical protein